MKKISEVIEELRSIYDEYGDVGAEMYDAYDMDMRQPVTHVQFDHDRQRAQLLSDRLECRTLTVALCANGL